MANRLFNIMDTSFQNFDATVNSFLTKTMHNMGMSYSHGQIFGAIFDAIKGIMQNNLFYIEDALTEQNIFMASRKKSVYSLAKISGYDPYYGSAATGNVKLTVRITNGLSSLATKIYLNNYSRITNKKTGQSYVMMFNTNRYVIDLNSPIITHEIKVVQGNYVTSTYTCTGEPLEKISVGVTSLFDRNYFDVYVNGEKWTQVSSLYDMYKDSKTYILTVGYENTFDVVFGNGVYGRIPDAGSMVSIKYIVHNGTYGNVHLNETTNFEFNDYGYDAFDNVVNVNDYVNIKTSGVISGGTNADSIEFVREMIGANSRSNVLASEESYKLFFKRFSFIGYVNCFCEPNSMTLTAIATSNVLDNISSYDDYYKITGNQTDNSGNQYSLKLTNDQKQMVINTINNSNKAFVGMKLKFEDPIIRKFALLCYVKIDDEAAKPLVKQALKDAFASYFINMKNDMTFIPKSDLIATALASDENIKGIEINIISKLAEDTYAKGYYDKVEEQYVNGNYRYIKKRVFYEPQSQPGLDAYGNISLDSKFEIPVLSYVNYYSDKDGNDKNSPATVSPVEIFFI